jgi:carbon-monoxide dehydrogenase large subunit
MSDGGVASEITQIAAEEAQDRAAPAASTHVGQAIRRKEDPRLITGRGRYIDDISLPGQVWAAFVRSPEAHAKIVSIDASAARERADVVAVFTGEDMSDLSGPLPMAWVPPGVEVNNPEHWPLARDEVHHVGDPVAVVLGTDRYAVMDAVEDVVVEYESLPVVIDPEAALKGGPFVHEALGTNKVHEWSLSGGDLEAGFAEAEVTIERRVVNHRTAGAPIEPRGVLADYRAGQLTMWSSTQVPHFARAGDSARGRWRLWLKAAGLRRGGVRLLGQPEARSPGQMDRDTFGEHGRRPSGP